MKSKNYGLVGSDSGIEVKKNQEWDGKNRYFRCWISKFSNVFFSPRFLQIAATRKREYALEFLKRDGKNRTRYWNAMETNKESAYESRGEQRNHKSKIHSMIVLTLLSYSVRVSFLPRSPFSQPLMGPAAGTIDQYERALLYLFFVGWRACATSQFLFFLFCFAFCCRTAWCGFISLKSQSSPDNGWARSYASIQHIKNEFGRGFCAWHLLWLPAMAMLRAPLNPLIFFVFIKCRLWHHIASGWLRWHSVFTIFH